jgi:hypothetical protein
MKISSLLFGSALGLAAGCVSLPPVSTTLPVAGLKAGEPHVSRANVSVEVKPILYTDLSDNRGFLIKLGWQEVDTSQVNRNMNGSGNTGKTVYGIFPLMPMPLFIVRISNHSGKVLDFSNAQLQLVDDKGKTFQLYSDMGAVAGRVQDDIISKVSAMQNQKAQLDSITDSINKQPVLTKKSRIADGADWQGYLVFKMDSHTPAELDKYLQSIGKLTVQLSKIGGDATPADISVPIEKVPAQLAVTCEGGKPQDFSHCEQQPYKE